MPDASITLLILDNGLYAGQELESACESLYKNNIINERVILPIKARESNESAINRALSDVMSKKGEGLLFFLAPDIELQENCLAQLAQALLSDRKLAGVNPLLLAGWIEGNNQRIAHMGTVFDCQKKLHYLYEGIETENYLTRKQRYFQLAHPSALLIRLEDFRNLGGFQTKLEYLAFPSLCISLKSLHPKGFSSINSSRALLHNRFDSWIFCGSWNSTLQRGRLDARGIEADYPLYVKDDGLPYKIDPWLNEYAALPELDLEPDPWLAWRHHPDPLSLIKFLSSLPETCKAYAIELARSLPSSLPRVFESYIFQNSLISSWAKDHSDTDLFEQCAGWHKRKNRFHHAHLKNGMKMLRDAGLYNCSLDQSPAVYDAWVELAENFDSVEIGAEYPEIAVLMPVWNPEPEFLIQALDSVLEQDYPRWQLCIADDASTNPEIKTVLKSYLQKDRRIKIAFRETNGHICQASNSALELVTAPYSAFFDHDDLLAPQALAKNAAAIAKNPALSYIYSDEDHIDIHNVRRSPVFRPDFDDALFFTGHLSNYKTDLLRKLGGLRPGTEGSQDYDLCLRAVDLLLTENIYHIPEILYHWRVHEKSTAGSLQSKPYVLAATKKVLLDAAARKGPDAEVFESPRNNFFRICYAVPPDLQSTIIIYTDRQNPEPSKKLLKYLEELQDLVRLELHIESSSGNWLENCNRAAQKYTGELLAFLYAGLEPLPECRLEQLLIMSRRENLAMTGGLIWQENLLYNGGWYPDISALPFPLLQGAERAALKNYVWGQFLLPRNVLAVPRECMVINRNALPDKTFLNAEYGELAVVDFALRQKQTGKNCLVSPWGQWKLSDGNVIKSRDKNSYELIRQHWTQEISASGLRNPHLRAAPDKDWTLIL